jgi:hypothetical protein
MYHLNWGAGRAPVAIQAMATFSVSSRFKTIGPEMKKKIEAKKILKEMYLVIYHFLQTFDKNMDG